MESRIQQAKDDEEDLTESIEELDGDPMNRSEEEIHEYSKLHEDRWRAQYVLHTQSPPEAH